MVRDGYAEAQAYILERGLIPETIQGREEELRQVSSSSRDTSMVLAVSAEAGSSSRTDLPNTRRRGTRRGHTRIRRGRNARTGSGSNQVAGTHTANGTHSTGLQWGEGTDR